MRQLLIALIAVFSLQATAEDHEGMDFQQLRVLIEQFLAGADQRAQHERIWAEDLIYTSSAGKRFGKADILSGMPATPQEPSSVRYSAEQMDIRLFDGTAVAAFMLVAKSDDENVQDMRFFNTGTFVKRDGEWRAVAWQATRIPAED